MPLYMWIAIGGKHTCASEAQGKNLSSLITNLVVQTIQVYPSQIRADTPLSPVRVSGDMLSIKHSAHAQREP